MSFTGKATYSNGATLPTIVEDVSDIISIVSPYETPLLNALGEPMREATSTYHEWLEDSLLPNKDTIAATSFTDPSADTAFNVENPDRFRVGDQIKVSNSHELMFVTGISGSQLIVVRGYSNTAPIDLAVGLEITIIGNAALEGSSKPETRFSTRQRMGNYTQIFTAGVEVSGSNLATSQIGVSDEMDYQKQERLRELIRDLENTVINGGSASVDPQGSTSTPRTMRGIIQSLATNKVATGDSGVPMGSFLDEEKVNYMLKRIWENSNASIDTIVVGGAQKRKLNGMIGASRNFGPDDVAYKNMVNYYESDFGLCKIILSRWMPGDSILFLDSSRVNVVPLAGRSFHFKPLASTGDSECGELIGEYTLELRNEEAHGILTGLDA